MAGHSRSKRARSSEPISTSRSPSESGNRRESVSDGDRSESERNTGCFKAPSLSSNVVLRDIFGSYRRVFRQGRKKSEEKGPYKVGTNKHGNRMSLLPSRTFTRKENARNGTESGRDFTEDALSNYLVLKNIFSNLNSDDITSCCQVNKIWNAVGDPLLVKYYDVTVDHPYCGSAFFITQSATYKSNRVTYEHYSVENAAELLHAAVQAGKVSINLSITVYQENESLSNFLSKFGPFVEKLLLRHGRFTMRKYCELIVRYFPNLKRIDLPLISFMTEDPNLDSKIFANRMRYVRTIDLGSGKSYGLWTLLTVFHMAPNLEEIHNLPVELVDAVVETGKVGCVKSVCHNWRPQGPPETFLQDLERLANLQLKLRSFSFEYWNPWRHEWLRGTLPFLRKMLQSSSDSLETLTLHRTELFDFESIAPMNALKEVKFSIECRNANHVTKFFSPNISLREQFPNVTILDIPPLTTPALSTDTTSVMATLFPENQFASWGLQIQELKLKNVSVSLLKQLHRLFPSIQSLHIRAGANIRELQVILPAVGRCWPELKYLTIVFNYHTLYYLNEAKVIGKECTLESILTGVPDGVAAALKNPLLRESNFSSAEIRNFKKTSPMRKFGRLKVLKFDLDGTVGDKFIKDKSSTLTLASKRFDSRLLPDLKLVVETHRDDFHAVSEIETYLKSLVIFEARALR